MAVSQEQLKRDLESELVTKVNQVGVDINFCIEHPHAENMLSFVSGFGTRKAAGLLKVRACFNSLLHVRCSVISFFVDNGMKRPILSQ